MTEEEFCLCLERDCALLRGAHVLAAVSGGADSTALLCFFSRAAAHYPLRISCAHVEHGIRGESSLEDMAFVQALCEKLEIPFYAARVDAPGYAAVHGCGLEDAARILRYDFLRATAKEIGADCIALAHHRRDQAETVLLHACRGSDVRGLCAMRARRGQLIRPLLAQTPQSLRDYLMQIGQSWREDETNESTDYARNRIRRDVLPMLECVGSGAESALVRLSYAAQRDEEYFESQLDALGLTKVRMLADGAALPLELLGKVHEALRSRAVVRLIERAGIEVQSAQVLRSVSEYVRTGQEGVLNLTQGAHACIGKKFLCITRAVCDVPDIPLKTDGETVTPFGTFYVRNARPGETGDGLRSQAFPEESLLDACIGMQRSGEAMVPFGRHSPVEVRKLVADAGIERPMRRSVPVLRSGGQVLWLAGVRPANVCQAGSKKMVLFRAGE